MLKHKSSRALGIVIKKAESVFSNGCIQQAYFLYKTLSATGYNVEFITPSEDYTQFELTGTPITFINLFSDLSRYGALLFSSAVLTDKIFLERCKQHNIFLINLICGNLQILMAEEYIFNVHHIIMNSIGDTFDNHWILPMYTHSKSFIELLTHVPAKITPYSWDTTIISKFMETLNKEIIITDCTKLNIYIFEPNMSIHKNSFIPLLIANEFFRRYPERLNKVFHICADAVTNNNKEFLATLDIVQKNKVETYPRLVMPYVIVNVQEKHPFVPIVISHNHLNELNFLHLELFHLGIPVFHNCKPYKGNSMFYDDTDLEDVPDRIDQVRQNFFMIREAYKTQGNRVIETYHSENPQSISIYKEELDQIFNSDIGSLFPKISNELNSIPQLIIVNDNKNQNIVLYHLNPKHVGEIQNEVYWFDCFLESLKIVKYKGIVFLIAPDEMIQSLNIQRYTMPFQLSIQSASVSMCEVLSFDIFTNGPYNKVLYCTHGVVFTMDPIEIMMQTSDKEIASFWQGSHGIKHHDEKQVLDIHAFLINITEKSLDTSSLLLVHSSLCVLSLPKCVPYINLVKQLRAITKLTIQDLQLLYLIMHLREGNVKLFQQKPKAVMEPQEQHLYGSIHFLNTEMNVVKSTHAILSLRLKYEDKNKPMVIGTKIDDDTWGTVNDQDIILFSGNVTVVSMDLLDEQIFKKSCLEHSF